MIENKFKVGDEVTALISCYRLFNSIKVVEEGKKYKVTHTYGDRVEILTDFGSMILHQDRFELAQPDLRDLLQEGYRYTRRNGNRSVKLDISITKNKLDKYLNDEDGLSYDIIKVERPTSEHGKPVEWITVWERKEELYTLEIKGTKNSYKHYIVAKNDNKNFRFSNKVSEKSDYWKCLFTQSEIENLPNQEFIKSLVKKVYE